MIELFDGYYIVIDEYNYAVATKIKRKEKDGTYKDGWKFISFHNSLADALIGFRRILVRKRLKNGCVSLTEALTAVSEIDNKVETFIRAYTHKA